MNRPLTDYGVPALRGRDLRREIDALVCDAANLPRVPARQALRQAQAVLSRTPPALADSARQQKRTAAREGRLRRGLARVILLLAMVLLLAAWIVPVAAEGIGARIELGLAAGRWAG